MGELALNGCIGCLVSTALELAYHSKPTKAVHCTLRVKANFFLLMWLI